MLFRLKVYQPRQIEVNKSKYEKINAIGNEYLSYSFIWMRMIETREAKNDVNYKLIWKLEELQKTESNGFHNLCRRERLETEQKDQPVQGSILHWKDYGEKSDHFQGQSVFLLFLPRYQQHVPCFEILQINTNLKWCSTKPCRTKETAKGNQSIGDAVCRYLPSSERIYPLFVCTRSEGVIFLRQSITLIPVPE